MKHTTYSTAQHPTEAALLDALDWCAVSAPELAGAKRDNYDEVAKLRQMMVAYFDSHAGDAVQVGAQEEGGETLAQSVAVVEALQQSDFRFMRLIGYSTRALLTPPSGGQLHILASATRDGLQLQLLRNGSRIPVETKTFTMPVVGEVINWMLEAVATHEQSSATSSGGSN